MAYDRAFYALAVAFLLSLLFLLRYFRTSYPPGPRGPPFLGAALSMPQEREWITYAYWKERYGPIVSILAFGRTIIILNTTELAYDLLVKQADISADRPSFPMLHMYNNSSYLMYIPDSNYFSAGWACHLGTLALCATAQNCVSPAGFCYRPCP